MAREYEAAALIVDAAVRTRLSGLAFGGTCAGSAYRVHGVALHAALNDTVASLRQWSQAAGEIAVVLRSSADRYEYADDRAGRRLG